MASAAFSSLLVLLFMAVSLLPILTSADKKAHEDNLNMANRYNDSENK